MTRKEIRDIMDERERAATKLGQEAAKRYLRSRQDMKPTGFIREIIAGIVFLILASGIIFIGMAL